MSEDENVSVPHFLDDVEPIERKRMKLDSAGKKRWSLTDKRSDQEVMEEMGVSVLVQDDSDTLDIAGSSQAGMLSSQWKRKCNIENVRPSKCNAPSPESSHRARNSESVLSERNINEAFDANDEETPLPLQPAHSMLKAYSTYVSPSSNDSYNSAGKEKKQGQPFSPKAQYNKSPSNREENNSPSKDDPERTKKNVFADVSDEVVLQIFRWLPKRSLVRCALVSRRWHRIASDESLWQRLELGERVISRDALGKILAKKPIVLRLANAEIGEWNPSSPRAGRVQYLDLSMANVGTATLNHLLSHCPGLKRLSLEGVTIDNGTATIIGECSKLETLNLTMASGLEAEGLSALLRGCTQLQSLNISWCKLSGETARAACQEAPESLERLNLAGTRLLTDENVAELVSRCRSLRELDISDCSLLTEACLCNVARLPTLKHLAISRCYMLAPLNYRHFKCMSSLKFLDVWGMLQAPQLASLRAKLPHISINQFMLSAIARPTVGPRRTSIWGIKTRD